MHHITTQNKYTRLSIKLTYGGGVATLFFTKFTENTLENWRNLDQWIVKRLCQSCHWNNGWQWPPLLSPFQWWLWTQAQVVNSNSTSAGKETRVRDTPSSSKTPNNALAMMGILFESSDVDVKMCLKVLFTLTVQSHHIFCNKQFDLFNFMCKQHDRNTLNLYVETVRKTVTFWRKLWIVFAVPLIVNV